ncbi:hypothetical protein XU18_4836 [Perkinsela sp. CCAP 1560/4]|nr:hypothetical protein XU18_4836 [Perkinsela sp. CCAP 1560/4]|eukprot:KNH03760.1 hypothetical protein XU18_4836 [Perkinsela sp. CCAP 1560/4]
MRPFTGLTFTTTGFTREEQEGIREKIIQNGGSFSVDVVSNTTHIIAAFGSTKKCLVARQLSTIEIVTQSWLDGYMQSSKGSEKKYLGDECFAKPLTGYVICVTEIAPENRTQFRDRIESHGGTYQGHLDTSVTHLIVPMGFDWKKKNANPKIVFAEKHDISIVYECWTTAVQSGFIVETEITDICRATPFYDVNDDLEIVGQSSSVPDERPVIEPYTAAEAKHFCEQRVQEGMWGQKNEEGMRSSVYAAFRSAFSSSIPERDDPHSPLLSSQRMSSPLLAAAVASQRHKSGQERHPEAEAHQLLRDFIDGKGPDEIFRHVRAYFVEEGKDQVPIGDCALFPSFKDPLMQILSPPNQASQQRRPAVKSEDDTLHATMKRAIVSAFGVFLPFLSRTVTHIIVPTIDVRSRRLSVATEGKLKSFCEQIYFPLSRVVTAQWLIESIRQNKALGCEGFGYMFGSSENIRLSPTNTEKSSSPQEKAFSTPQRTDWKKDVSPRIPPEIENKSCLSESFSNEATAFEKTDLNATRSMVAIPGDLIRALPSKRRQPLKRCTFQFSEGFSMARRICLSHLIRAYGGVIQNATDDGLSSTKNRNSTKSVQKRWNFLVHPHEFEYAPTGSPCSPPPWNQWISPLTGSQTSKKHKGDRKQMCITSSWIFGFLVTYWRQRETVPAAPVSLFKMFLKETLKTALRRPAHSRNSDSPRKYLWLWYYVPIRHTHSSVSKRDESIPTFSPKVVLYISKELQREYFTISSVILSMGGTISGNMNNSVTHILEKKDNCIEASPGSVSMRWLEESVRAGYLVPHSNQHRTPLRSLGMSPVVDTDALALHASNHSDPMPLASFGISPPISSPTLETPPSTELARHAETPLAKLSSYANSRCATPVEQFQGTIRVAFSFDTREERDAMKLGSALRKFGATVSMDFPTAEKYPPTHLISSIPSPRLSVLCALARGMWILQPQYAAECVNKERLLPEVDFEWTLQSVERHYQVITVQHTTKACRTWRERRERSLDPANFGAFQNLKVLLFATDRRKRKQFQQILEAGNVASLEVVDSIPEGALSAYSMVLLDAEAAQHLREISYHPPDGNTTPIYTDRWLLCFLTCQPLVQTKLFL